jgi:hypothetical protein
MLGVCTEHDRALQMQQHLAHFLGIVIIKGVFTSADTYYVQDHALSLSDDGKIKWHNHSASKAHQNNSKPSTDKWRRGGVQKRNGTKRLTIYLDRIA